MHIQERTTTNLTTCTKMTEEVDRRHGVNGNSSGKVVNEDVPIHGSAQTSGGRLKFFKDGKFILELVRGCTREGERAGWVSVPRKTFWPPAAPPAHLARSDRAASLSVSDDNSSIQSSPWQRDHCWKQTNPRKNISKELALYYCRPNTLLNSTINSGSRLKRRRPLDTSFVETFVNGYRKPVTNGVCVGKTNGDVDHGDGKRHRGEDRVDGSVHSDERDGSGTTETDENDRWTDADRDKYYYMKLKKPYQYHKLRVYKKTKPSTKRKELAKTLERLREKIAALPAPVNAKIASCKQEHTMVSPRKRILRELERVSLEDGHKRRAKLASPGPAPVAVAAAALLPAPGPSRAAAPAANGARPAKSCSYSISSLLSMPEERAPPPAVRAPTPTPPPYVYAYLPPGALYRPAPTPPLPLWLHYWPPLAHHAPHPPHPPQPPLAHRDRAPKEEPASDLPLNLSKH